MISSNDRPQTSSTSSSTAQGSSYGDMRPRVLDSTVSTTATSERVETPDPSPRPVLSPARADQPGAGRARRNKKRKKRSAASKNTTGTSASGKADPCKLYVSFVPEQTPNDVIAKALSVCGTVKRVERPTNRASQALHYVFVTMASPDQAAQAVAQDSPVYVGNTRLTFNRSRRPSARGPSSWIVTDYA